MTITTVHSPNYSRREGRAVDLIVIHVMEGDMEGTAEWFTSGSAAAGAPVSAHYGVSKTGAVVRYVEEEFSAWHAGRVDHATAQVVLSRPGVNPNLYSIGIEHEGTGTDDLTDAQRAATMALVADICARHTIPVTREHIVGHHEIYAPKSCPGQIDVDRLVSDIQTGG